MVGPLPAPSQKRVDLTLKFPTGSHTVNLSGTVVRVEPDVEPGSLRIAVKFEDLAPSQLDGIEVMLARILESPATSAFAGLRPGSPPHEVKRVLEAMPLSIRVGLATRAGIKEREFLRQDQNAAVLESLVRNPGLTVADARALATSPFLMPGTIEALATDLRFGKDEELRMTLATHPRVSPATAERITADFKGPQLRKLLARGGLEGTLRVKLLKRLTRG